MLTREEAQRIAAAVNALRPDWAQAGLMTVLSDERIRLTRTYRDTAVAFVALAADPESRKPTRIFEHGPWWESARPVGAVTPLRKIPDDACATCFEPERAHVLGHLADHSYLHPRDHARALAARTKEQR